MIDGLTLATREFLSICEEAGSPILHTSGSTTRTMRRVVQVIPTRDTETFPTAVTSEGGQPNTQDRLRRGDALLYAAGLDGFAPGDAIEWRGRTWAVVGTLGAEMLGDAKLYEEVGLRRLAVTAACRAQGTIKRAG